MALSPNTTGQAIADYLIAQRPPAGHAITDLELATIWKGIMTIIDADITGHAVVLVTGVQTGGGSASGTIS